MDSKEIEELLPFYALDALTDEERQQVESYLAGHPETRTRLESMAEAVSALPQGLSPVEPPRRIKDALMARVYAERRARTARVEQPSRRVRRFENIFQALSLGAAIAAIIWAVALNLQLQKVQKDVALLGDALAAQSNSLEQINAKLPELDSSAVVTITVNGTEAHPRAHGELIADPNSTSAVLVIAGLGQLEAGKTYQVWLIDGSGPQSAGLLTVDKNGQGVLIVTSDLTIGSFQTLGISVEPDGGSAEPTGEIVVLSDL